MRGLFTFRNGDSLMSCRFSQWSLLGCCVSDVAQLTPDKPAGAHFLRRQAREAVGSGSRFSSLLWQPAREGLNQGPWETAAPYTSSFKASSVVGSVVFQAVSVAIEIQTDLHFS